MVETKKSVLVVDDEEALRYSLRQILELGGYEVHEASSGEEALAILRERRFSVVLLDLMLGGRVDGLHVLDAVRWRWPDMAAVILTAHGSLDSAVAAIRQGVDGYLLKPVEASELRRTIDEALQKCHALAEPSGLEPEPSLRHGPFALDLGRHVITMDDRPLELTAGEFALLAYLVQHGGRTISARELVQQVSGYRSDTAYEARELVKWYVFRLRRKIEPDPAHPRYLLNTRGVGYRLVD